MKILFFNYEYPPLGGGAGNATKYLLQSYAKYSDVEVDLITSAIDDEYTETSIAPNIRMFRLPIGKDGTQLQKQSQAQVLRYAWEAYRFSRNRIKTGQQYDMIHAFFAVPCGAVAWALSKEYKIPYIVSLRGADVPGYAERFASIYGILKPIVRVVWKNATRVISNSEGLKQLALKTKPDQAIDMIYNGVDTEFFCPDPSKRALKTPRILCASRLTKRKGFAYAIEGFSKIADAFPSATMIIAGGDGDAAEELRAQVRQCGLEDRIEFTGEYDHKHLLELQQSSDIFLFPSLNEGMSNSMLEAMASGLPVVMTPTGGAQEVICDGDNGFLIRFRDSDDIAEKLTVLLSDPKLRSVMGESARATAETLSWSSVAKQYRDAYVSVYERSKREK
jgi:glycosyltransferase involved in cell wall biosynthesis